MYSRLKNIVVDELNVSETDFDNATAYVKKFGGRIETVLVSTGALAENTVADLYSKWLGLARYTQTETDADFIANLTSDTIDYAFFIEHDWFPIANADGVVTFAVKDPLNPLVNDRLTASTCAYVAVVANIEELSRLRQAFSQKTGSATNDDSLIVREDKLLELASEAPTINLVNNFIYKAVRERASDMHIESGAFKARVRYRIDGVLHDIDVIQQKMVLPVVTRIKILSGMDIAEKRRPQDGKIEMSVGSEAVDIRVSVLPQKDGESIVMRFLRKDALQTSMEILGISADIEEKIKADLHKTAGVILLTGPTGSGKTTSLYSFLSYLNKPEVKIITLEDPIEYQLEGITQTQIHSDIGFNFAAGLRSVVRQDPDVIMVGEIRDQETASIAMQSALTGHLVFSTVHTNNAPSAYTRLIDLGVDEFLINASLISIVAQRLARKLCADCAISSGDTDSLVDKYGLDDLARRFGVKNIDLRHAVGCEKCNFTGYTGRVAIIEYLACDEEIRHLPKDSQFISLCREKMKKNNERTLVEDGLLKAICGLTTIEEVFRVAG